LENEDFFISQLYGSFKTPAMVGIDRAI